MLSGFGGRTSERLGEVARLVEVGGRVSLSRIQQGRGGGRAMGERKKPELKEKWPG